MAVKNYYELLELPATASSDEIKRAFRHQIARYHPDKVQHLGKEFQAMAADRAAELTEAYRVLSDEGRRGEYDRSLAGGSMAPAHAASAPGTATATATAEAPPATPPPPSAASEPESGRPSGSQFARERATIDQFVRNATIGRLRQALEAAGGGYDESAVRPFDLAWTPKRKLFAGAKGPRLAAQIVSRVDGESVADAWTHAAKWAAGEDVCVLLIGPALASAEDLAKAITDQRRKSRGAKVSLVPVDARNWDAHLPHDAPLICKSLLTRLRTGA
jgi:curved DNA-binding protein CbpA